MATETKKVMQKVYTFVQDIGENVKCPPQARLIIDLVKAAPGGTVDGPALVALMSRPPAAAGQPAATGGLVTKQDPKRVLGFYRPMLKEMGTVAETEVEVEIQVEVPDKPAKPAKAETAETPTGEAAAVVAKPSKSKGAKGDQKAATQVAKRA